MADAVEEKTAEQPGVETFTTKADKTDSAREIEITWPLGKDVNESIELFGAEVVHGMFRKSIVIAAQANIRRMLLAANEDKTPKYTDDQIRNFVLNEYKPGVRAARGISETGLEKLIAKLMKLPEDKRKEALAALMKEEG